MADESYVCAALKDYGLSGGWGIAITTACKDPLRAFEFLDWMCSKEAQILVNWGIEGVNYKVIDNKRVIPDDEQRRIEIDPDYKKKRLPLTERKCGSIFFRLPNLWEFPNMGRHGNILCRLTQTQKSPRRIIT